jgi:hypothetical protein
MFERALTSVTSVAIDRPASDFDVWPYEKKVEGRVDPTAALKHQLGSHSSFVYAAQCQYHHLDLFKKNMRLTPECPACSSTLIHLHLRTTESFACLVLVRFASETLIGQGTRPFVHHKVAPLTRGYTSKRGSNAMSNIVRVLRRRLLHIRGSKDKIGVMILDHEVTPF